MDISAPVFRCEQDEAIGRKWVAVVGDNDLVCLAIKLALRSRLELDVVEGDDHGSTLPADGPAPMWDLIIVAITSESAEPIAELAESSLIGWIGRVPLLIISSRPFPPSAQFRISHLRFPFDPDHLCARVQALLPRSRTAVVSDVLV